jgi:hypothetical protein
MRLRTGEKAEANLHLGQHSTKISDDFSKFFPNRQRFASLADRMFELSHICPITSHITGVVLRNPTKLL